MFDCRSRIVLTSSSLQTSPSTEQSDLPNPSKKLRCVALRLIRSMKLWLTIISQLIFQSGGDNHIDAAYSSSPSGSGDMTDRMEVAFIFSPSWFAYAVRRRIANTTREVSTVLLPSLPRSTFFIKLDTTHRRPAPSLVPTRSQGFVLLLTLL